MTNEELNKIMMKADNDLEALKDRCHELYDRIDKAIEYIGDMPACIWNEAHEYNYDFDILLNILQGNDK